MNRNKRGKKKKRKLRRRTGEEIHRYEDQETEEPEEIVIPPPPLSDFEVIEVNPEEMEVTDPLGGFVVYDSDRQKKEYFKDDVPDQELEGEDEGNSKSRRLSRRKKKKKKKKTGKTPKEALQERILYSKDGYRYILDEMPKIAKKKGWGLGDPVKELGEMLWEYEKWLSRLMPDKSFDRSIDFIESMSGKKVTRDVFGELLNMRGIDNPVTRKNRELAPDLMDDEEDEGEMIVVEQANRRESIANPEGEKEISFGEKQQPKKRENMTKEESRMQDEDDVLDDLLNEIDNLEEPSNKEKKKVDKMVDEEEDDDLLFS